MINIELKEEDAYRLAIFLGVQDIGDTQNILSKYDELDVKVEDMENSLQLLFNKLSKSLNVEI